MIAHRRKGVRRRSASAQTCPNELQSFTISSDMFAYAGVTDFEWFTFLSSQPGIEEVNFWKPGGQQGFAALEPGAPFLFKLHSPRNVIAGGGFFVHFTRLPTSLVWEAFGIKNGATSLAEMRRRIEKYRKAPPSHEDYSVGCIVLGEPFFLSPDEWVPVPEGWSPNIVSGRKYDLLHTPGRELWGAIQSRLAARGPRLGAEIAARKASEVPARKWGDPISIFPRLGQGSFRVLVTDAYGRRCAITGERTLPALDAAHIQPFGGEGVNRVQNGLLLRSDLHRLFDRGYITVRPDHTVEVSRRIREEFENGRDYYALSTRAIQLPQRSEHRPDPRLLEWHADSVFQR